ncbi:aldo/keto reductase [Ulvibacterium marinum]|uniref:Aldo/keto reductase n=1 Tax=Ulvibacterium marinum TaxID=2419782 RepID=A0A3B0CE22_9FLAO|nr:aldo/keto reductase [Ulvibacterium marinum]RKN83018.1 aldo/keto reductase [Ulvibacterium marinum]
MENTTKNSRIIAGAMTWGQWGKQLSKNEIADLIHHCLEVGITTFDHADIYGGYTNETDFGQGFAQSGITRNKIQLITKCGIQYVCDARKNRIKHYDYSSDYIVWSAEQSLKNLRTDYVDLFLLHRPSPLMHPDEIADAIGKLKKEGKIKEFGVSNFTPAQIAMLETGIPVSANQVEFSLTAEGVMYDGTLDDCLANQRMAMSWSPLGSYFKEINDQTERIKSAVMSMLEKYSATEDQLLLAWIMAHPANVHPVVGTTTKKRLEDANKASEIQLDLEDWFILLEASQGHKVP